MDITATLARHHATELRAEATAHRLAAGAAHRTELRTRLGQALIEVGSRLAAPRPAAAVA
ncbi:hypothetical protein [Streptomyces sp. IBSBF 3136]|uniref:hypothetical protein n=1 Tax=Streptomyces sp. IBSBF 3136 TaxID=2903524 RepID=UPI002FDBA62B